MCAFVNTYMNVYVFVCNAYGMCLYIYALSVCMYIKYIFVNSVYMSLRAYIV